MNCKWGIKPGLQGNPRAPAGIGSGARSFGGVLIRQQWFTGRIDGVFIHHDARDTLQIRDLEHGFKQRLLDDGSKPARTRAAL
jgi:hypothetical protein